MQPSEQRIREQKVERALKRLDGIEIAERRPLGPCRWWSGPRRDDPREAIAPAGPSFDDQQWASAEVGQECGDPEEPWSLWLRLRVPLTPVPPESWSGIYLRIAGGEGLCFLDGHPLQGVDGNHDTVLLPKGSGQDAVLALEWSGGRRRIEALEWRRIDRGALTARVGFQMLWEAMRALPADHVARVPLLLLLDGALGDLPWDSETALAPMVAAAWEVAWRHASDLPGSPEGALHLVGQSHIDVAWLWPLAETERKTARTASTALNLMARYPHYLFTQTQPVLYEFLRDRYPEVSVAVGQAVQTGRWEPLGGMWVEPDGNLPSGEAFARQILLGQRYFRERFGRGSTVCWLPDTFGFAWTLPQLLVQGGMRAFATTKLSWNQTNRLPADRFWWEGLDGTRVLAQMYTEFNGNLQPGSLRHLWQNTQPKETTPENLYAYGFGDGGGGPTIEMLERLELLLQGPLPGIPRVTVGPTDDFFDRALASTENLPVWNGELYLELHRGTYTSQARTKSNNRQAEQLYRQAELWSTLARLTGGGPGQRELDHGWRLLLRNQFHDILPGSGIRKVYEDADTDYAVAFRSGEDVRRAALAAIAGRIAAGAETQGAIARHAVFNSLPWSHDGVVAFELPEDAPVQIHARDDAGEILPCQVLGHGARRSILVAVRGIPPVGYRTVAVQAGAAPAPTTVTPVTAGPTFLENAHLRAEFDAQGRIARLVDKDNGRDVFTPGESGNALRVYEDRPVNWDAWDIDFYYPEQGETLGAGARVTLRETGPVRATIEVEIPYHDSMIRHTYTLDCLDRCLRIPTVIDWHEHHRLLKASFPFQVRTTTATYEIPFGHIQRPTHRNTSWDWARFEVAGQRFADLSEGDWGVALLNDGRYGHDARDGVLSLSLLRSPTHPDREADQGISACTYAVYPHAGTWWQGGVLERASELNAGLRTCGAGSSGDLPSSGSLLSIDRPGVTVEAVKAAEDGDGSVVVRLVEWRGSRGPARLTLPQDVTRAERCNLLEEPVGLAAPTVVGSEVTVPLRPYEIVTLRLWFGER